MDFGLELGGVGGDFVEEELEDFGGLFAEGVVGVEVDLGEDGEFDGVWAVEEVVEDDFSGFLSAGEVEEDGVEDGVVFVWGEVYGVLCEFGAGFWGSGGDACDEVRGDLVVGEVGEDLCGEELLPISGGRGW